MKKRLLSALLALCMILSLFPASAFASTGDTWGGVNASTLSASLDDLDAENAGSSNTEVHVNTSKYNDKTKGKTSLGTAISNVNSGKADTIVLDVDVTLDGNAAIITDATIKGQNHTITVSGSKGITVAGSGVDITVAFENLKFTGGQSTNSNNFITVGNQSSKNVTLDLNSVTFENCQTANRILYVNKDCTVNMNNSLITGSNGLQEVIHLYNGGKLVMNGSSSITNCTITNDGAVCVDSGSTLTMNDSSSISNCTASKNGGGVYVSGNGGKLEMNGTSKITGCKAAIGGGVYANNGATVSIGNGAALYGNTATNYAADVFADTGSTVTLPAASGTVSDKTVTGWYKDASNDDRHSEDDPNDEVKPEEVNGQKLTKPLSLMASRSSAHTVTVKVTYDGVENSSSNDAGAYKNKPYTPGSQSSAFKATDTVYLSANNSSFSDDGTIKYVFDGWTVPAGQTNPLSGGEEKKTDPSFTMPDNDVTLIAKYVRVYIVTVKVPGKTDAKYESKAGVTVPSKSADITEDGVQFANWETDESSKDLKNSSGTTINGSTSSSTGDFTMPAHDVTLTAVAKYKVTVPAGTTVTVNDASVTLTNNDANTKYFYAKENDKVNLTYSSDDQQFNGWTVTDKDNKTVTVTNNTFKMPASPVTATADTTALYHITVKYQLDNGDPAENVNVAYISGTDSSKATTTSVNAGAAVSVSATSLSRMTGADSKEHMYKFTGWKEADSKGSFSNADSASTTYTMPDSNVTLIAQYVRVYTVTVDRELLKDENGSPKYFAKGDSVNFTSKYPAESSKEDTVFDSWNRDNASTGLTINGSTGANNTIQGSFTMPAHDVVLTSVPKYKVTVAGGTVTKLYSTPSYSASSMYVTAGTTISIASSYGAAPATPNDKTADTVFYKWTSSNYSTLNENTNQKVQFEMPAQPITVTSVNKYKVTVVGGKYGAQHESYGYEEADHQITLTPDTAPAGKTFKGWVVTPADSGAIVNENSVTTPNPGKAITITASYDDNLYTVYVNGTAVKSNVTKDTTVTFTSADVENLTKETADSTEDVVFGEWSVDTTPEGSQSVTIADKANPELSFTMPAGNVYLTYSKKYKVTVTDGTIGSTGTRSGYFATGADVELNYTGTGVIKNWTVGGETIENNGTYTVKESAVTATPVLKNQPIFTFAEPKGLVEGDLTSSDVEKAVRNGLSSNNVNMKDTDKVHLTYYDKAGNELEEAPSTAGSYTFTVTIDADDTQAGGTFTNNDFLKFTIEAPVTPDDPADGDGGIGGAIAAGALIGGATYLVGTDVWLRNIYGFIPTNRIELAKALWNKADCPAPVSTELYPDIDEDDTDAQSAARWVVEQGLMKDYTRTNDDGTQTVTFKPGRYVARPYALSRWYELKKLLNEQQAAQAEAPAETTAD